MKESQFVSVYSTEPEMTRALAAEIRNDHRLFTQLLERNLGIKLGEFQSVQCEKPKRVDVVISYSNARVGIEAKFDHELTSEQIEKERKAVDRLVLLVLEPNDAKDYVFATGQVDTMGKAHASITWEEAIRCFSKSRITPEDVRAMPDRKRHVTRVMDRVVVAVQKKLGDDWSVVVERGASGMPGFRIERELPLSTRKLAGGVGVAGRGMPNPGEPVYFQYLVGIMVGTDEYPERADKRNPPAWVEYLAALDSRVIRGREKDMLVSTHAAGAGNGEFGRRKVAIAKECLDGRTWLAKGYTDGWAIGVRSTKQSEEKLDDLCDIAAVMFKEWFDVCQEIDAKLA